MLKFNKNFEAVTTLSNTTGKTVYALQLTHQQHIYYIGAVLDNALGVDTDEFLVEYENRLLDADNPQSKCYTVWFATEHKAHDIENKIIETTANYDNAECMVEIAASVVTVYEYNAKLDDHFEQCNVAAQRRSKFNVA